MTMFTETRYTSYSKDGVHETKAIINWKLGVGGRGESEDDGEDEEEDNKDLGIIGR